MMKRSFPDKRRTEKKHILLCDPSGGICEQLSCSEAYANNSLQCLNQAVIAPPDIIAVCFDALSLTYREMLLELCIVLKQNPYTKDCLILALLNAKHRMVVEALQDADVDFVKFSHPDNKLSASFESITENLGEKDKPE